MSKRDHDSIEILITDSNWIFAKTMPENPHYYMLRKECENDVDFVRFVETIREHGHGYKFKGREYTRLIVGDWYYWTMGSPIEETILINRCELRLSPDE
jgi:hypothetical protein